MRDQKVAVNGTEYTLDANSSFCTYGDTVSYRAILDDGCEYSEPQEDIAFFKMVQNKLHYGGSWKYCGRSGL